MTLFASSNRTGAGRRYGLGGLVAAGLMSGLLGTPALAQPPSQPPAAQQALEAKQKEHKEQKAQKKPKQEKQEKRRQHGVEETRKQTRPLDRAPVRLSAPREHADDRAPSQSLTYVQDDESRNRQSSRPRTAELDAEVIEVLPIGVGLTLIGLAFGSLSLGLRLSQRRVS